jgi:hypothetical protein
MNHARCGEAEKVNLSHPAIFVQGLLRAAEGGVLIPTIGINSQSVNPDDQSLKNRLPRSAELLKPKSAKRVMIGIAISPQITRRRPPHQVRQ